MTKTKHDDHLYCCSVTVTYEFVVVAPNLKAALAIAEEDGWDMSDADHDGAKTFRVKHLIDKSIGLPEGWKPNYMPHGSGLDGPGKTIAEYLKE